MEHGMTVQSYRELPAWWWLGIPLAMFSLTLYGYFGSDELMKFLIRRDTSPLGPGLAENGTVLILLPGIAAGVAILLHHRAHLPWWLAGWVLAWVLACVYFAGEEASWGQHYFRWGTPEEFRDLNDQQETNLHNIGTWFDQKPRTLVELWMVVGGLLLPLWWRLRGQPPFGVARWRHWFWPTTVGAPATALFLFALVVAILTKKSGSNAWYTLGSNELREFYLASFLSSYLLSIWYRLRQVQA
jgi:hypothetical protein